MKRRDNPSESFSFSSLYTGSSHLSSRLSYIAAQAIDTIIGDSEDLLNASTSSRIRVSTFSPHQNSLHFFHDDSYLALCRFCTSKDSSVNRSLLFFRDFTVHLPSLSLLTYSLSRIYSSTFPSLCCCPSFTRFITMHCT